MTIKDPIWAGMQLIGNTDAPTGLSLYVMSASSGAPTVATARRGRFDPVNNTWIQRQAVTGFDTFAANWIMKGHPSNATRCYIAAWFQDSISSYRNVLYLVNGATLCKIWELVTTARIRINDLYVEATTPDVVWFCVGSDEGAGIAAETADMGVYKYQEINLSNYSSAVITDNPSVYYICSELAGNLTNVLAPGNYVMTQQLTSGYGAVGPIWGDVTPCVILNNNGYWTSPNNAIFQPGANPWTIELWWRASTISQNQDLFCAKDVAGNNGVKMVVISTNRWRVEFGNGATTVTPASGTTIVKDFWYHFVITWDGVNTIRFYTNGAADGSSGTVAGPVGVTVEAESLGARNDGANRVRGNLAHVAWYNGVQLSAARVLAHYNAGHSGTTRQGSGHVAAFDNNPTTGIGSLCVRESTPRRVYAVHDRVGTANKCLLSYSDNEGVTWTDIDGSIDTLTTLGGYQNAQIFPFPTGTDEYVLWTNCNNSANSTQIFSYLRSTGALQVPIGAWTRGVASGGFFPSTARQGQLPSDGLLFKSQFYSNTVDGGVSWYPTQTVSGFLINYKGVAIARRIIAAVAPNNFTNNQAMSFYAPSPGSQLIGRILTGISSGELELGAAFAGG